MVYSVKAGAGSVHSHCQKPQSMTGPWRNYSAGPANGTCTALTPIFNKSSIQPIIRGGRDDPGLRMGTSPKCWRGTYGTVPIPAATLNLLLVGCETISSNLQLLGAARVRKAERRPHDLSKSISTERHPGNRHWLGMAKPECEENFIETAFLLPLLRLR